MSNESSSTVNISFFQRALIFVCGILAPIFVIYTMTRSPAPAPEAESKVVERIKPVAMVEVSAETGPHVDKSGEEVVNAACAACHMSGAMGSPKIGDKAAWASRITQGYETLTKHATEGIRMMPARGGNADLTDIEMANAVAYMANKAGAKFTAPKPAEPAAAQ